MVDKITDIEIELTDEQLNSKWYKLKLDVRKLLKETDWTQLNDSPVSLNEKKIWAKVRNQIRSIKKSQFNSIEEAQAKLDKFTAVVNETNNLVEDNYTIHEHKTVHVNSNLIDKTESPNSIKKKLKSFINIKKTMLDLIVINEAVDEAVDFMGLDKNTRNKEQLDISYYPLLKAEFNKTGKPLDEICESFFNRKKILMAQIIVEKDKFDELLLNLDDIGIDNLQDLIDQNNTYYGY